MQSFLEFSEEKKIVVKTKMGGEIPATIKVTGKDYHIVKADASGKQYKVDHQGNSLEEEIELSEGSDEEVANRIKKLSDKELVSHQKFVKIGAGTGDPEYKNLHNKIKAEIKARGIKEETDKDLPFTPDVKKTKPSTPGKYGSAYSTVRNLARKALEKQKQVKEEEQLDEKSAQARANKARKNVMDAGRGIAYRQKTGVNLQPKDTGHDSYQAMNKALGRQLRRKEIEEELQEGAQWHKVNVTVSDPNHTAVSQRNEKQLKRVVVKATDKGDALAKAQAFYKKKGYKIHDVEHHSVVPATTMKTEETDLEEGYRGSSKADEPYWEAEGHKKEAEKARKSGDNFSYHKFMSAHHDALAHWNTNKGRHHVADQHAMKADNHEDWAQEARKEKK